MIIKKVWYSFFLFSLLIASYLYLLVNILEYLNPYLLKNIILLELQLIIL